MYALRTSQCIHLALNTIMLALTKTALQATAYYKARASSRGNVNYCNHAHIMHNKKYYQFTRIKVYVIMLALCNHNYHGNNSVLITK